ncbi:hypothetical protein P389DRAFT_86229 [Cystobasidium minutum MCA 4210]|uniref:uncharacterized protein n=1 Tax=Cystobasidium minutum MCA 4210 TaxID=1397322 RepID=UPI0034CF5CAD|eukprot:jgi/Rhomi1/86229/CE86228_114
MSNTRSKNGTSARGTSRARVATTGPNGSTLVTDEKGNYLRRDAEAAWLRPLSPMAGPSGAGSGPRATPSPAWSAARPSGAGPGAGDLAGVGAQFTDYKGYPPRVRPFPADPGFRGGPGRLVGPPVPILPPTKSPTPPPPPPPPSPPPPSPPPPPPNFWPNNIQDWQRLRQSFANSPHKNYGGTRGDSAFINWALSVLQIGGASIVLFFSYQFLTAYGDFRGQSQQDLTRAYYCCQFLLGLSILTAALLLLYVLWVFADGRHPMRKAWMVMGQERAGKNPDGKALGFTKPFNDAHGSAVRRPGLGTASFETINRFTTNRLFAERTHIRKMLILYMILFVAWVVPSVINLSQMDT